MTPIMLAAPLCSALVVGILIWRIAPPPRPLRSRLQPYVMPSLTTFRGSEPRGAVATVFGPILRAMATRLGSILDRYGAEMTVVKLRQAGWYRDREESEMVAAYRLAQLQTLLVGLVTAAVLGQILSVPQSARLALLALGAVVGLTRQRSRVERAIETRRETMRIEIYTVDQLLAMRVRAGGGVMSAVQTTVARGRGEVVAELADALRLHRAGWGGGEAFRRIAELTPDSFCSRTYRLLATAEERGADLASALLELAEDVRESRRESIKRSATRRRAAMLVPTIAILAPVLMLFVAAPLPYLITGWK